MSIEAVMTALTEATEKNTAVLERVLAGQEAALAKLDQQSAGKTSTRTPRATKAAEEPAAATTTPAAPAAAEQTVHPLLADANPAMNGDQPTPDFRAGDFSAGQVKSEFVGYMNSFTDPEERKATAGAFVAALGQNFGVKLPFHPTEGLRDDEQRKQALYYLRLKRAGHTVDFNAEYDFDGPVPEAVEAEEDMLG